MATILFEIRKSRDLTLRQLAKLLDVSFAWVSINERRPTWRYIDNVLDKLELTTDEETQLLDLRSEIKTKIFQRKLERYSSSILTDEEKRRLKEAKIARYNRRIARMSSKRPR